MVPVLQVAEAKGGRAEWEQSTEGDPGLRDPEQERQRGGRETAKSIWRVHTHTHTHTHNSILYEGFKYVFRNKITQNDPIILIKGINQNWLQ